MIPPTGCRQNLVGNLWPPGTPRHGQTTTSLFRANCSSPNAQRFGQSPFARALSRGGGLGWGVTRSSQGEKGFEPAVSARAPCGAIFLPLLGAMLSRPNFSPPGPIESRRESMPAHPRTACCPGDFATEWAQIVPVLHPEGAPEGVGVLSPGHRPGERNRTFDSPA
jgi:hypothetical protein